MTKKHYSKIINTINLKDIIVLLSIAIKMKHLYKKHVTSHVCTQK